jgi:hypothetical protein
MSTIASGSVQTKAPGDEHGSAIAFGFIVGVLVCLAAVISLLGASPEVGPLLGSI